MKQLTHAVIPNTDFTIDGQMPRKEAVVTENAKRR